MTDLPITPGASAAASWPDSSLRSPSAWGALGKLPPAPAVAAMQSINAVVINPWFLSVFMGMVALCPHSS